MKHCVTQTQSREVCCGVFTSIKMHSRILFSVKNTVLTFDKVSTLDLNSVFWSGGVDFSQMSQ